jgi:HK97 family phage major capsid protein
MSKLLELREKRTSAWEKAKAFLDSKRGGDDLLSPEDSAAYDKMEAVLLNYGREIERLERLEALEANIQAPKRAPVTNAPSVPAMGGRASADYKMAFWNAMRGRKYTNALQEGTDSEGGYLVPDEFEHTLIEALENANIFRQFAHVIHTSYGERKIPIVATKGTASWVDEEGTITDSDTALAQVSLSAYKLATLMKVSDELLNDSVFNLEAYIAQEFARRIGNKEEEAFLVGDGSGKPTGIFAATGGGQAGVTAGGATALTIDNVIDLYHSLKQPYRAKAVFITNDSTIKAIRKLKDTSGQYLWQPAIKDGAPDTILGKAVYTSQYVPAIAAGAAVMAFGDFSYYWIGDRQGRTFQRLNELYAVTGQRGFIATQRVDGKLILPEAVQILKMAAS